MVHCGSWLACDRGQSPRLRPPAVRHPLTRSPARALSNFWHGPFVGAGLPRESRAKPSPTPSSRKIFPNLQPNASVQAACRIILRACRKSLHCRLNNPEIRFPRRPIRRPGVRNPTSRLAAVRYGSRTQADFGLAECSCLGFLTLVRLPPLSREKGCRW